MTNWLLIVYVSVAINGQRGWTAVEPDRAIYETKEDCIEAAKKWKNKETKVICRQQYAPTNYYPMPPFPMQLETVEVE